MRTFFRSLPDDNTRLAQVIIGVPEQRHDAWWEDINTEVRKRLSWRSRPDCHTLTFEALVGSQGGGDDELQRTTVLEMARHLGVNLPASSAQQNTRHIFARTTTFRRGQIASWRDNFTPDHKDLFKQVAGDLLIELGYEKDYDW